MVHKSSSSADHIHIRLVKLRLIPVLFISCLFIFCTNSSDKRLNIITTNVLKSPDSLILRHDTVFELKYNNTAFKTIIKVPVTNTTIKGIIIALPGWNFPADGWCNNTKLCNTALKQGFVIILPGMGESIYAEKIYKETRKDWSIYPTRKWVEDTLIKYIQSNFKLLLPSQNNYLLGLSTGARGVALLCIDCKNLFKKAAALSGDYDPTKLKADNLYNGFYGSYNEHKERWIGSENIVLSVKEFNTPIYLGHGRKDKVVPCTQTIEFCDSLKKYKHNLQVKLHIDENAEHNYKYWDSEVDNVLNFFSN